jgi:hypothetical protein
MRPTKQKVTKGKKSHEEPHLGKEGKHIEPWSSLFYQRQTTIKVPKTRSFAQARLLSQKRQQSQDELEETA